MPDTRWTLTALLLLSLVVLGLVGAVVLGSPSVEVAVGRAGIITATAAGPIGVLIMMLQLRGVDRKMNGHLEAHIGHTDRQVLEMIDARLRELASSHQTVQAPPDVKP
jgi:hypothetical protein